MATVAVPFAPLKIYDIRKTDRKLGAGAFGTVFEVEWNGTACAAKFMHDIFKEILSAKEKKAFITAFEKECATWSALRHPQIVQFLGVYFEPSSTPVMVLEKMDASLRMLLESTSKEDFPLINKVVILRQVSQGLVYLHSHSPKLVHHDLSPNNILVNEVTYLTKLTDFGMTRAIDAASFTRSSSIKGTPGFMPPEALHYPLQYDDKLDVFSYGNVIIMTITHQWPTHTMPQLDDGERVTETLSEFQLREHHIELFSMEEMKYFGGIIKLCLENLDSMRPTSAMLLAEMKKIEEAVLEDDMTAETEASKIQLAMWRMQKVVQKKESEIARMSEETRNLQSNISRFTQNAQRLEQLLEHLHLEAQMQESVMLNVTGSSAHYIFPDTGSETDPLLTSGTHTGSETIAATSAISHSFKPGNCAYCLFTSMVILSVISILCALGTLISAAIVVDISSNMPGCYPSVPDYTNLSCTSATTTAAIQILLSVALTTALIVRFLLWCRGERWKGLTLICSPVVMLLTVSFCTTCGIIANALIVPSALAISSVSFIGLALVLYHIGLQWMV